MVPGDWQSEGHRGRRKGRGRKENLKMQSGSEEELKRKKIR